MQLCAYFCTHIAHLSMFFLCTHCTNTQKYVRSQLSEYGWLYVSLDYKKTGFSSTSCSVSDDYTVFYSKFANLIFGTYHWDFTPIAGRASIFSAWILLSIWGRLRSRPLGLRWASGSPRPCWRRLRPSPRRTWSGSSSSYRQNFMIQGL